MNNTKIQWANLTWYPVRGCTPISPACDNCYTKKMAVRLKGRCGYSKDEPFAVTLLHHEKLSEPIKTQNPSIIFMVSIRLNQSK